jgi:iron(III) transport system ATP-binding protein
MSVIENVSYGLNFSNFDKEEIKDRAYQGLELVGLKAFGNRLPSELSGRTATKSCGCKSSGA